MDIATLNQDLVVAENTSNDPIELQFHSKRYILPPSRPQVIPIGAARLWLGHWEIADPVARLEELKRLQTKHGVESLGTQTIPVMPISLTTMDGDPITTVLDDPAGATAPVVVSGDDEVARIRQQLEEQATLIQRLQERLGKGSADLSELPTGSARKPNGRGKTKPADELPDIDPTRQTLPADTGKLIDPDNPFA